MYRLSGAGDADRTAACGVYDGTGGQHPPRHEQKKAVCHRCGAAEFRLRRFRARHQGRVANGIDEKAANSIYDSMVDFAKYAFNKSHAAAYAVINVQTAWLKFYYPVEFMAALMTSVIDNSAKAAEYLLHCKELGISVLPPDINVGQGESRQREMPCAMVCMPLNPWDVR